MTYLLDANVLIALCVPAHELHDVAAGWLGTETDFALCPITEGALVRYLVRIGERAAVAQAVLDRVRALPRARFWPDDVSYADADLGGVVGHRQVTDAYLVALARAHGGKVATFGRGLASTHPSVAEIVGGTR